MDKQKRSLDLSILTEHRQELYGFATLWIIVFHSYLCNVNYPTIIGRLIRYGNMGCEIFLLLSGICLYFSYYGSEQLYPFLKKRLLRLYVPLVLIETWYWIYDPLIKGGFTMTALKKLASKYLTLSLWTTGDSQIWFVSFLVVAYLMYPYIYHFLFEGKRSTWRLACLLVLAVTVTMIFKHTKGDFYDHTEIALTRFPVFFIGCYFGRKVYRKEPLPRWIIPVCAVLVCVCFFVLEKDVLHSTVRRYFYAVCGIPLTFVLAWFFHRVHWKPLNAFLRFLGNMTLELYLTNIICIRVYKMMPFYNPDVPSPWGYIAMLIINIGLAYVAYRANTAITPILKRKLFPAKAEKSC